MKKFLKKLILAYLRWEQQMDQQIAELPEVERNILVEEFNNSTY